MIMLSKPVNDSIVVILSSYVPVGLIGCSVRAIGIKNLLRTKDNWVITRTDLARQALFELFGKRPTSKAKIVQQLKIRIVLDK